MGAEPTFAAPTTNGRDAQKAYGRPEDAVPQEGAELALSKFDTVRMWKFRRPHMSQECTDTR